MRKILVVLVVLLVAVCTSLTLFRQKEEQGDAKAQHSLGPKYYYGKSVAMDETEAIKWYRKAAEQGDVGAQYYLGVCYDNGEGVAKDTTEAVKWYRKAAEQGDNPAKEALQKLGVTP